MSDPSSKKQAEYQKYTVQGEENACLLHCVAHFSFLSELHLLSGGSPRQSKSSEWLISCRPISASARRCVIASGEITSSSRIDRGSCRRIEEFPMEVAWQFHEIVPDPGESSDDEREGGGCLNGGDVVEVGSRHREK